MGWSERSTAFSGRTIIPSTGVGSLKVDAEIKDQPWDLAFNAILAGQGLAATELPDAVIVDGALTGMDGYAFTAELKADDAIAATPVVIVAAYRSTRKPRRRDDEPVVLARRWGLWIQGRVQPVGDMVSFIPETNMDPDFSL